MAAPIINIKFFADLKQFSTQMDNAARSLDKVGKRMQRVGGSLSKNVTAPILALGTVTTATFAKFEQELAKVQAISGATGSQFQALKKNAEDLGAATRFTASEVAGLQLSFSKLGFSPDEILNATEATLALAQATGEDLANSATVAASTLKGFGLGADETQRVVDVMAASFSSSALNLEKFQVAMATVAPVAKTANQSIEDTTGFLSVLVNAGLDASTAGTGLRNIFLDIAKSGDTLEGALGKIQNSSNKNATALQLFGKRGATVATVLAENFSAANGFADAYRNAGGEAQRMAAIMDDTLEGSLARLKSATEGAAIAFGEVMAPTVRSLVDGITDMVGRFKALDPETKKFIVVAGGIAAAIGPAIVAVGTLLRNLSAIIPVMKSLTVAIAANPIGALAVVIGAVAGTLLVANSRFTELTDAQAEFASLTAKATTNIAREKAELDRLLVVARDETRAKEDRQRAISRLNSISPKYLGNLNLENINTDKAAKATERYVDALLLKAKVIAAEEKLVEVQKDLLELQLGTNDAIKPSLWQNFRDAILSGGNAYNAVSRSLQTVTGNIIQENSELTKLQEKLTSFLNDNQSLISSNAQVAQSFANVADAVGGVSRGLATSISLSEAQGFDNLTSATDPVTALAESAASGGQQLLQEQLDAARERLFAFRETLALETEKYNAIAGAVSGVFANMSQSLISSFGEAENGFARFAQKLVQLGIQLVAQLAAQAIKTIAIKKAEAVSGSIANATQSAGATGPAAIFTQPAFIATLVGGVLAAFASIPKFATGGVVGGGSFTGDKILARLNSGELVLNAQQQNRLLGMLDGGGRVVEVPYIASTLIEGSNLRVVLDRADRQIARNG